MVLLASSRSGSSIMWSATQSHMFSKYPDAPGLMCIMRLAALQPGAIPEVRAGHSAGVRSVPAAPPMLTWQSQRAAEPFASAAMFHSMSTAPAVGPLVVKIRSCISTLPTWPGRPTRSITVGLVSSEKAGPRATSCDHVSPTILTPAGTVTVPVRMYEPASTNRIFPWLESTARWKAAVSSVTPSPLAPKSLTWRKSPTLRPSYCGLGRSYPPSRRYLPILPPDENERPPASAELEYTGPNTHSSTRADAASRERPFVSATAVVTPDMRMFSITRPVLPEPASDDGGWMTTTVPTLVKDESMISDDPMLPSGYSGTNLKPVLTSVMVTDFHTQPQSQMTWTPTSQPRKTSRWAADVAANKGDVRDAAAAAVLGEDALLARAGPQLDVLHAGGLGHLVVQAGRLLRGRRRAYVDDDVADLAVEVGRVDVPLLVVPVGAGAAAGVLVGRQHPEADEGLGGDQHRAVNGVADDLRAEGEGHRAGDEVRAGREVDDGVLDRRPVALLAAPPAVVHGSLDGGGVVGHAVAGGAVVEHVAEHGVRGVVAPGDGAFASDGLHPVRAPGGGGSARDVTAGGERQLDTVLGHLGLGLGQKRGGPGDLVGDLEERRRRGRVVAAGATALVNSRADDGAGLEPVLVAYRACQTGLVEFGRGGYGGGHDVVGSFEITRGGRLEERLRGLYRRAVLTLGDRSRRLAFLRLHRCLGTARRRAVHIQIGRGSHAPKTRLRRHEGLVELGRDVHDVAAVAGAHAFHGLLGAEPVPRTGHARRLVRVLFVRGEVEPAPPLLGDVLRFAVHAGVLVGREDGGGHAVRPHVHGGEAEEGHVLLRLAGNMPIELCNSVSDVAEEDDAQQFVSAGLPVLLSLDGDAVVVDGVVDTGLAGAPGVGGLVVGPAVAALDPGGGGELITGVAHLGLLDDVPLGVALVAEHVCGCAGLEDRCPPGAVVAPGDLLAGLGAAAVATPAAGAGLAPAARLTRPALVARVEVVGEHVGRDGGAGVEVLAAGGAHEGADVLADVGHVVAVVEEVDSLCAAEVNDVAPGDPVVRDGLAKVVPSDVVPVKGFVMRVWSKFWMYWALAWLWSRASSAASDMARAE
ncbi:hypothetical protein ColKHC_13862 [Colletotrichum higginsianum]|nr:hypothetical protein ColKHC_13862 [Colletotrichum higginsianum]